MIPLNNRPIEFRAWIDKSRMIFSGDTYCSYLDFFTACRKVHDGFGGCYLMQYTGLKDKNGVKIFEGDVLKFSPNNKEEEIFIEMYFHWYTVKELTVTFKNGVFNPFMNMNGTFVEVIGNIYQNPELLKENYDSAK